MEINSNVTVKSEMKDYDPDFEVKNIRDEKNFIIVKKEIVKNEEQEVEISEDMLPSGYHYPYPNFKIEEELNDKDLYTHKQIKTECQDNDLCSNVDQSVGEYPENCDVDEKVDISEVTLLSTENNQYENVTFGIEDEKPRIFDSKQSSSDHLQQEEEVNNDLYKATNETVLNMHITSVHNHEQKIKMNCDFCSKSFSTKMTLDDHVLQMHNDRTNSIKSKKHTCTICLYQSKSKYNLKRHIDSIHNEIKISCEFCDKSFSTNKIRDNHVLKNHKDKTSLIKSKIHTCTLCPYQATSIFDLNRHINFIHNKQKIHCDFCDKSFSKKMTLNDHVLKNHEDKITLLKSKIHICSICSYQTTIKCLLNRHINFIHKKQKINCDFCDKSFSKKITLDNHVLKKHKDKTSLIKRKIYICTICSYQTTVKCNLKIHIDSIHNKHKINCDFCDKSFSAKMPLDDHVLRKHNNRISAIKSKILPCTICSYQTTSKSNLQRHINLIHNEQKIKIKCEFCDKSYSTNRIRDNHVLKKHKDKTSLIKSKIYTCTICPFQTTSIYHLNKHINLFHNKRKIHCDFCDKSFSETIILDDHVLRNHKDKTTSIKSKIHTCTICSFQTTFTSKLKIHIDSIHNTQRINCEFCDKSFSEIMLDDHVLKNHKDKISLIKSNIYSCTICPYQTTSYSYLNRHIDSVHKKQKVNCGFCHKSFSTKAIRDNHVLKNHKDHIGSIKRKIHTCTICSYQNIFKSKLNRHIDAIHMETNNKL